MFVFSVGLFLEVAGKKVLIYTWLNLSECKHATVTSSNKAKGDSLCTEQFSLITSNSLHCFHQVVWHGMRWGAEEAL